MKKPIYSFLFLAGFFLLVPLSCKKDDPFNDDYEPNNSRSKATSIELGSPLDAGIGKDDSDWYRIVVDNDGIIDITEISITDVSANLDVACTIYDSNGNPFYSVHADAGMDYAVNLASRGGIYYIEISSYAGSNTGYYTLQVNDTNSNDDFEPDESFGDARLINSFPATNLTGNIIFEASSTEPNGDWEYFKVLVRAGKKVSFQVAPDETDMVLQYELFGNDQVSIQSPVLGSEGQALSGSFNNPDASDTYFFIKLGGKPSNRLNGDYTISFTEANADPI